jgi:hypothetical protein
MGTYENAEFWTEDRCITQRRAFLNVVLHLDEFPKADEKQLWAQIEEIEAHMLATFATVRVLQELTSAA